MLEAPPNEKTCEGYQELAGTTNFDFKKNKYLHHWCRRYQVAFGPGNGRLGLQKIAHPKRLDQCLESEIWK
jgi:hypothetical protein